MDFKNYELCKKIEAIDIVLNEYLEYDDHANDVFNTGTKADTVINELMDLRNNLEKEIWLNNQSKEGAET